MEATILPTTLDRIDIDDTFGSGWSDCSSEIRGRSRDRDSRNYRDRNRFSSREHISHRPRERSASRSPENPNTMRDRGRKPFRDRSTRGTSVDRRSPTNSSRKRRRSRERDEPYADNPETSDSTSIYMITQTESSQNDVEDADKIDRMREEYKGARYKNSIFHWRKSIRNKLKLEEEYREMLRNKPSNDVSPILDS